MSHLWADSYKNAMRTMLRGEAASSCEAALVAAPAVKAIRYVNPAAPDAYLHGQYLWFGDHMEESGAWFRKAINLQPIMRWLRRDLPTITGRVCRRYSRPPPASFRRKAAERALELDPDLPRRRPWVQCSSSIDGIGQTPTGRFCAHQPRSAGRRAVLPARLSVQAVERDAEAIDLGRRRWKLLFSRPYALPLYVPAHQFDAALGEIRLRMEADPSRSPWDGDGYLATYRQLQGSR